MISLGNSWSWRGGRRPGSSCAQCSLSWRGRCYVNWLLFGKWGRSPSYEQNAPHCHALAPFQDVFHLRSRFSVPFTGLIRSTVDPTCSLSDQNDWAASSWVTINRWKRSLAECRFAGMWGWLLLLCVFYVRVLRVTTLHSWSQCIPLVVHQNDSFLDMFFFTFLRNVRYFKTGRILKRKPEITDPTFTTNSALPLLHISYHFVISLFPITKMQ